MKKLLLLIGIAAAVAGCKPTQETQQATFEMPAVDDVAMYQVNPRVFAPEKSLNAVADRIDSIRDLGVNVMWVMPIYPIGIEKGKNSPYCISDYKAIAPEFGTIEDFKKLTEICHEHGMGMILDWVANHTAWDHPWMKEHPDWYTRDEKADTIICPQPWNWEDVADGVPADFWKEAIDELRAAAGDRKILMLAEGKNADNFTVGGFDMNYGWDYKDEIVKVWKGAPASDLIKADKAEYDSLPAGKVKLRFTTNHDHSTEATPCKEFTNDRGAMAAYVASIFPHGGALIYSSQEVGYPEPINFFHYVPVDWTAKPEIYKEYQTLIRLYNEHPALRKGKMTAYPDKDVLVFEKTDAAERFLVLVNVRNEPKTVNIPESWVGHASDDEVTGQNVKLDANLELAPYQYLILAY